VQEKTARRIRVSMQLPADNHGLRRAVAGGSIVSACAVVHALGAGTDASTPWLRAFLLVTGVPIVVVFVHRLRGRRPARVTRPAAEGAAG
jgi:hypothetical protein